MKDIFLKITDELTGKICQNVLTKGIKSAATFVQFFTYFGNIKLIIASTQSEPSSGGLGGLIGYGKKLCYFFNGQGEISTLSR